MTTGTQEDTVTDFDITGLAELAADVERAEQEIKREAFALVKRHAQELQKQWRANARQTALPHGKHYPRSITAEQIPITDPITWEVGPDSALRQGGMGRGFEYGSANQPPHWDGSRATVAQEPKFNADIDKLMKDVL